MNQNKKRKIMKDKKFQEPSNDEKTLFVYNN
jgi:hypothetical protein